METLIQDLRYGVRMLVKNPGFTIVAVIALALGIGANTAIFSVVNAVLLRPLPYKDPDRLVMLQEKARQLDVMSVSYPNFVDWRKQNQTFDDIAVVRRSNFNVTGGDEAERVTGRILSANFFSVLGVEPAIGRNFLPEENEPGADPVVIVSYGLWQRRFGGDPNLIGKPITINDKDFTIIGILPSTFQFFSPSDLFVPINQFKERWMQVRGSHPGLFVIGRMKEGVTLEQARADMDGVADALAQQYPQTNGKSGVVANQLFENVVKQIRPTLLVLIGAVGFVLLIACANVANLLLARSRARHKEIAIRAAIGASRLRIIRQLLTESLVLAVVGGGLGLLIALWGTDALVAAIPDELPRAEGVSVDGQVLGFTLAVSLATGIIFGLVPALQSSKLNLHETLKEAGRGSTSPRHFARSLLVVVEVALALVLLIGAGLMIRSVIGLTNIPPGFDPKNVLALSVSLSPTKYTDAQKVRNYYQETLDRVQSLPGVTSAAWTIGLPLLGSNETSFSIGGRPRPDDSEEVPLAVEYAASPDFLRALGIPLLRGRYFTAADNEKSSKVVIIDEALARRFFPDEDAIGKRLLSGDDDNRGADAGREIVGVVGHVKHYGLDTDSDSRVKYQFHVPYTQLPDQFMVQITRSMSLVVKSDSDPTSLSSSVRSQIQAVDKDQPVYDISTMERAVANSILQQRFAMLLLGTFAALALVLATVGIYGVISYSVTERTHEIGIRMALGAQARDVLRLVVRQGMILTAIGVAAGLGASFILTRLMASLLYRVSTTDPATFAAIALILTAVALAACAVPARRATKVDPMVALRHE
ncbi:MAG TPA: ABC transporter permease [Blastocatellia bacterium]|nr:ABC transporter permease [Blastocatellia bacterium]